MTNRITLAAGAGAAAVLTASAMIIAAGWLSEVLMPVIVAHRAIFTAAGSTMGTFSSLAVIFFAYRQHRTKPEEPMKPRIRNGQIG